MTSSDNNKSVCFNDSVSLDQNWAYNTGNNFVRTDLICFWENTE